MTVYAVTATVFAVIGCLIWFSRIQRRSVTLAHREDEIRKLAKIHEKVKQIDEQSQKQSAYDVDIDPRAQWLHSKKRVSHVSSTDAPGNQTE